MIFKSARLFRFTKEIDLMTETLEKQLAEFAFVPCDKYQSSSFGWIEPLGKHGSILTHQTDGRIMLCACKEERLLPAAVLRDTVEQEIEEIEEQQQRRVFPSEKRRLKEDAVQRMLPQAFTKRRKTFAYIDAKQGLLVVEATTLKLAEELCQLLRQTLGSLPVVPVTVQQTPSAVMSHWLQNQSLPDDFETGDDCVLQDQSDTKVTLRTKGIDIHSNDFTVYLEGGMRVIKLSIAWKNQLQFVLNDDLAIGRIRFDDLLRESTQALDSDDFAGRFDADFALMGATFRILFSELFEAFGGIDESIS